MAKHSNFLFRIEEESTATFSMKACDGMTFEKEQKASGLGRKKQSCHCSQLTTMQRAGKNTEEYRDVIQIHKRFATLLDSIQHTEINCIAILWQQIVRKCDLSRSPLIIARIKNTLNLGLIQ